MSLVNSMPATAAGQGFGASNAERIPLPKPEDMSEAQKLAAQALIEGPRKAVFGPFVPLMQTPRLMDRIGKVGETLRFESGLPDRVREWAICVVARETSNQFEWQMHAPLARKAGIAQSEIDALAQGRRPTDMDDGDAAVLDFVTELMRRQGVSEATFADIKDRYGDSCVVELTGLVGYFVMVCWIMNVARTPGVKDSTEPSLYPFPL